MSLDDPNAPKQIETGAPAAVAEPAAPTQTKAAPSPPAHPAPAQLPQQIQDFDDLIKGDVQTFVDLGEKIGSLVEEQVRKPCFGMGVLILFGG